MPLPGFHADNSLYRTPNNYRVVFDTGPQVRPDLVPISYKCEAALLDACIVDVRFYYRIGLGLFRGCHGFSCEFILEQELTSCRSRFGCPANHVCSVDAKTGGIFGTDVCCPLNTEACDGICRQTCPPGKIRNPVTCDCRCANSCAYPFIIDPDNCACKCPSPCPISYLQDPINCSCYCPPGTTDCGGRCVVLGVDRQNCGSCGTVCAPNEDCCLGVCVPVDRDPNCGQCGHICGSGQVCCAPRGAARGYCSNLNTPTDCGACGMPCNKSGMRCCSGVCTSILTTTNCGGCGRVCQSDQGCCNGVCTSLNTTNNCGTCGRRCQPGLGCCNGVCTPLNTRANCGTCGNICGTGWDCCDGMCKNIQTDPQNCGACGKICTGGKICSGGNCVCPPMQIDCNGFCCATGESCCSNVCRNLQNDPQNCGSCGNICSGGKICVNGGCVCPAGTIDCGGICVNPNTDIQNCGVCGRRCGPTSWCEGPDCVPVSVSCVNGTCVCPQGWSKCSDTSCCAPQAPVCTGLVHQTQWGPRTLCCDAGKFGGRNYYTGGATCCRPQDVVSTDSDGVKRCF